MLPRCKQLCTSLCEGEGSRCKSSREHHFDCGMEGLRTAESIRPLRDLIPPWQRSVMHRTRNAVHAGAAPAGGSNFFKLGEEHRSLASLISWRKLVQFQPPELFQVV